jgi:glutathione S-transferase
VTGKRLLIHAVALFLLPLLVAWLGLSLAAAGALVVLALLWRWLISLSAIAAPAPTPELELETISASHFAEKVRWCMDRMGLEYREKPVGGTLGAFFLGRTVPVLKFQSGLVRSSIGNSPEILRYLWGRYANEPGIEAQFLEPTPERLAFEKRIDRCGTSLQVWIYGHILDDRRLTLHAWGCHDPAVPLWQRMALRLLFPLLRFLIRRAFRISAGHKARAVENIAALLGEAEEKLGDGRRSILGGATVNYTDLAFAAIMGLWLMPPEYGGGRAEAVRIERARAPRLMRGEIENWRSGFPKVTAFVEKLYERERRARPVSPSGADRADN